MSFSSSCRDKLGTSNDSFLLARLSHGRVTQRENHGTMILHGISYSAYTLRYRSYCMYGIAPSSQSSMTFYGISCDVCLGWYLRPIVFPPMLRC